jgi:thioredoxin-like negative regulator of GroEL
VHRVMYFILIESLAIFSLATTVMATDQLIKADLSNSDGILKLNDSTENNAINKFPFFVLDCYVPWCEPCKTMSTALYELAGELRGQVTFGLIDIENNSVTTRRYNITSYPTLLIFKNGMLVDSQEGYGSKSELVDLLQMDDPGLKTGNAELAPLYQPPVTPFSSNSTQMTTLVPIRDLMA